MTTASESTNRDRLDVGFTREPEVHSDSAFGAERILAYFLEAHIGGSGHLSLEIKCNKTGH